MTREFDDLMRAIEADWNFVTTANVRSGSLLHPVSSHQRIDDCSILQLKLPCNLWIEVRLAATTMPSKLCTVD
jgi:hypothetical protein